MFKPHLLSAAVLGCLLGTAAQAQTYPITAVVTPADGSRGTLDCPASVPAGGSALCVATARPGNTFHYDQGIGGCDQPGDTLGPNHDSCAMANVQGPRTLTARFVPGLPPPTRISATPDGAGHVTIGWTLDTELSVSQYTIWMAPLPLTDPPALQGGECIGLHLTSCTVPNYQLGTAYVLDIHATDGRGGTEHHVNLGQYQTTQFATVSLPGGGLATLLTEGPPPAAPGELDNICMLTGAPAVQSPDSAALAGAGAPIGSTAPLGTLRLQARGCAGQAITVRIDYPAGTLAGRHAYANLGTGWQTQGEISGDTIRYTLFGPAGGALDATLAPLAVPPTYTVGGGVSGLTGSGLVLSINGGDDLPVSANGPFRFAQPLLRGSSYHVQVKTQPGGQTCNVAGPRGSNLRDNVTDVQVTCHTLAADNCTAGGANARGHYILGDAQGVPSAMHWDSGLVWKRCAEGQGWDGAAQQCTGSRSSQDWGLWAGAQAYLPLAFEGQERWRVAPPLPASHNRLADGGWRMAYRGELLGITEGCGASPTLNRAVFPETLPLVGLWSASPYAPQDENIWFVNFDQGYADQYDGIGMATRLVRGGQPFAGVPGQAQNAPAGQPAPVELPAFTLAASAPGQAWGGARIAGDGSPEFRVGSGPWVTEAIVASGNAIIVRLTAPAAPGASHHATLVLRSGQASGTTANAANGGDEATAMRETSARFSVTAAPPTQPGSGGPRPVPALSAAALALLGLLLMAIGLRRR
ncbi:MAG: DUF1566 domain-containing protein [Comamonas sp.]